MQRAIIFLTIIFLTNFVGMYYGFYDHWWFDISLHFLGGFFMAMLMVRYLADLLSDAPRPSDNANTRALRSYGSVKLKNYLIIIGAVSFIGVVWEFAEYLANQTLVEPLYNNFGIKAYFIGDLDDTINDLLMDILGALTFALSWRNKLLK